VVNDTAVIDIVIGARATGALLGLAVFSFVAAALEDGVRLRAEVGRMRELVLVEAEEEW
jgi:hypothetical protein